jgi:hypothetical protein
VLDVGPVGVGDLPLAARAEVHLGRVPEGLAGGTGRRRGGRPVVVGQNGRLPDHHHPGIDELRTLVVDFALDRLQMSPVRLQPDDGAGQAGIHVGDLLGAGFCPAPGVSLAPAFHGAFLQREDSLLHRCYSLLRQQIRLRGGAPRGGAEPRRTLHNPLGYRTTTRMKPALLVTQNHWLPTTRLPDHYRDGAPFGIGQRTPALRTHRRGIEQHSQRTGPIRLIIASACSMRSS